MSFKFPIFGCNLSDILIIFSSYVCHAEVNAILNTNHATAAGQVGSFHICFLIHLEYLTSITEPVHFIIDFFVLLYFLLFKNKTTRRKK